MAHQRIAPNQGEMQWAMFIHQREYALHQIITTLIMKLPQTQSSNMPFFIGVTSGAAQRTLPRNLNCERRTSAAQDALPSLNDFARLHSVLFLFLASDQHRDSRHSGWMPEKIKGCHEGAKGLLCLVKKRINKA
jgi:hypothetical protein